MFTNSMEKFKKAWPETAIGLISIAAGILLMLFSAIAVASPIPADAREAKGGHLTLVGVYLKPSPFTALLNGFTRSTAGKGVTVTSAYGRAARQVEALQGGRSADVVGLDLPSDVDALAQAGVVSKRWDSGRYRGIVANSVIAFAVRKDNPQGINTWRDIAQPNIDVLLASPFKASGGLWAIAAAYGSQRELGRSQSQALDYLRGLLRNVSSQDPSDRLALKRFLRGEGDVLVAPESEIQAAIRGGSKIELVVPKQTILVDLALAQAAKPADPAAASAFLDYAWSAAGQAALAKAGLRPVLHSAEPKGAFAHPAGIFGIRKVGGWTSFQKTLEPQTGEIWKIEDELGFTSGSDT
jgi:ABC-type sulfate transport system substrate-binding protein